MVRDIVFSTRGEDHLWTPPIDKMLAYAHGGRLLTETLPLLARIALVAWAFAFAAWWIAYWGILFLEYERWSLVCATLVHFTYLAAAYLFGRVAWLRLDHLRRIPPGETAALRSFPIVLRLTAETFFLFTVANSVRVLAMPSPPPPQAFGVGSLFGGLGELTQNPFAKLAFGVGASLWAAVCSLFVLVLFYALANFVEVYLAIELNTRNQQGRTPHHDALVRQGED